MIREREYAAMSGWTALGILVAAFGVIVWQLIRQHPGGKRPDGGGLGHRAALSMFLLMGLFVVNPNEGKVLQFFGRYIGTAKTPGLRYANPLYAKKRISLRVRNFESAKLKVNDLDGNPIEIAAVVVWKVVDTAEAVFEVDNFENYVHVQSESALRNMATSYPYDAHDEAQLSLRGHTAAIADHLRKEIQDRLSTRRRRGHRGAHHATWPTRRRLPPRCCSASRPAPSSPRGRGSSKAPWAWSRWRSTCSRPRTSRRPRRRAQGRDGQQPARRAVRRPRHAAGGQRRARCTTEAPGGGTQEPSCCGSTPPFSTHFRSGPMTSCAASTDRSSSCCAACCSRKVVSRIGKTTTQVRHEAETLSPMRQQRGLRAADVPDDGQRRSRPAARPGRVVPQRRRRPSSCANPAGWCDSSPRLKRAAKVSRVGEVDPRYLIVGYVIPSCSRYVLYFVGS